VAAAQMVFLIGMVLLGVGLLAFWIQPLAIISLFERLTPNVIYRVRTNRRLVGLSFDDGPHPTFTPEVLEILQRHDAKATFFLIGDRALRHPEVVARIKADGHEVGNHYLMDASILGHSDAVFVDYLEQTEKAIGIADRPKLFRPPGGVAWPWQLRVAQAHGYVCVLGSAYANDPMHPPVWHIRWLIEKNLVPGAIVILHDGISDPRRGIQALPHILASGRQKGLRFVSIGTLMRDAGEEMDAALPPERDGCEPRS
jgi:peptidoglycan/xylan/chitin deacetylase (PgdA/CDA1 family)